MEKKRALLGVQKNKKPIKRSRKRMLKKVLDYLKSDFYMFGPLISPPTTTDFLAPKTSSFSTTGKEMKESLKGKKNKKLVEKIGGYLQSDSYMYAPLCVPQPIASPQGRTRYIKKVTMEISTQNITGKDSRQPVGSSNVTVVSQFCEGDLPQRSISSQQQKSVQRETAKHMVYDSCRHSCSVSGKVLPDPQSRKILIE